MSGDFLLKSGDELGVTNSWGLVKGESGLDLVGDVPTKDLGLGGGWGGCCCFLGFCSVTSFSQLVSRTVSYRGSFEDGIGSTPRKIMVKQTLKF